MSFCESVPKPVFGPDAQKGTAIDCKKRPLAPWLALNSCGAARQASIDPLWGHSGT